MPSALQRISYVEDEPDIRSVAEFALTRLGGFTVDLCDSGRQAIEKTPAFGPDIILLDVMMPGMDGIETFRRLKEIPALADTPIVFVTAKAMPNEIKRYLSMGAAEVIAKPFDPVMLSDRLRKIWDRVQLETAGLERQEAGGGPYGAEYRDRPSPRGSSTDDAGSAPRARAAASW